MSIGIEQTVVRIYYANQVVGSGVLVAARLILTCAHVISKPLGFSKPPEVMPVETVSLDFPLAQSDQKLIAQITIWDSLHDIAGLELIEALDYDIQPAPLVHASRLWGHPFKAFGFPNGKGYKMGVWVEGEIRGPNAAGWIQIDDTKQTGYFVQQGFSGGPVWDDKLNGVAGIVVTADMNPGVHSAFMIPSQVLYRTWPEIPEPIGVLGALHEVQARPEKYLPRLDDIDALKELLLGRPEKSTAIVGKSAAVGLQGMGGIGKSVLAAAAVQETEVRRAFPDGIIWLTLGQEPNLTARQEDLARALGEKEAFKDKRQGRTRLRELLADKTCLIILDDIWDYRHVVDGFDCLGADCRMMITTRNLEIVANLKAAPYTVELLSEGQSLVLLAEWAGHVVAALPAESKEIVKECGCLPLALAMVGALVQQNPESWAKVLRRLQKADLEKIQEQFPAYPYPDLLKAIQVSVDALPASWQERYLDFAVFPEDAVIPPAVLKLFWIQFGLDEDDVEDVLDVLVKRSLARRDAHGNVFLHDLQHDYVRKQAGDLAGLHRRLVAAYREVCKQNTDKAPGTATFWANGPGDGYFFAHIVYHLIEAAQWSELFEMLCAIDFLSARCRETSVYDLQNDYRLSLDAWKGSTEEKEQLAIFEERIRLEAGRIHQAPDLLFPILYNNLSWFDVPGGPVHRRFENARNNRKGWLHSLQDPRPQPQLWLRSLEGHTGGVNALVVTPDGRQVVSGAGDSTLKVWDLESGRLVRSLERHVGRVSAVVVTPDGLQAVSAASDNTLKVWDLESGRLVRSMEGHTGGVNALVVTPDGRQVVSGAGDSTLKVWDLESGRLVRSLEGHLGRVSAVVVTPDGRHVVSGAGDKTLKIWDLESGQLVRSMKGHRMRVNALVVTPDGRQVVSGSFREIKVWDLESGRLVRSMKGHTGGVKALVVTPDGHHMVSGASDNTLKVWDLESGRLIRSMKGHTGGVKAVVVTPDGRHVVSGAGDKTLKVWDLESGRLVRSMEGHTGRVNAVVVTPDGRQAVSAASDNTLKVWDLESGRLVRSMEGHTGGVNALVVTPDGRQVVSGAGDNTLKVWDLESGQLVRSIKGHTGRVNAVVVTPDGRQVVSGADDRNLKVWDLESGRLVRSMKGHTGGVYAVVVTPDGREVISGMLGEINVWDLESGRLVRSTKGHAGRVNAVVVTPDGCHVVSGAGDKTLKVWDLENGQLVRSLEGHTGGVKAVVVTPDGRQVVSGASDNTLKVWGLESGRLVRSIEGHMGRVNAVVVTPDGRHVVSGASDNTLKVWDLESGRLVRSIEGHMGRVNAVVVTPDGRQVVSAASDNTLKVWDLESGRLVRSIEGHTGGVKAVVVTPDGRQVVSGAGDSTLKVWDLESGRLVRSLEGHTGGVNALVVTPDGRHVVSGASDNTLKVWNLESGRLVRSMERHAGRVSAVVVTPDGLQAVSAASDNTLKVWDLESGRLVRSMEGHTGGVNALVVTPDGRQVVSGANDNTLKVWDLESGQLVRSMKGYTGGVNAVVVTPDGRKYLSGSSDKTIRLWIVEKGSSQILFWNDAPITCLALSIDNQYLACGDSTGRVWIFEWIQ